MNKHIQLSTTDHLIIAIHALFIFLALKLAFTNHVITSMLGWIIAYLNLLSFDTYSMWRKNARQG